METMRRVLCYNCFQERESSEGPCPYCGFDLEENMKKFPVALRAGTELNGRYIIGRVLGQGGFGITYLAWDTKLQAKVAVKEFMPGELATRVDGTTVSVLADSKTEAFTYGAERFQEEARTLAKFMGQPNIAGVTDYFDENDTSYFVMDYIEGISFKTYIANHGGTVSVEETLNVMIPVLQALTAVHAEGFIHRDVTPDNIYITKDGVVKLLDFGSARYSVGDKSKSLDVILKVGYAPKEQYIRRSRQGPYTDVYSCAACFYAAITGYLPPESLERLDKDELQPISALGIEIPEYLDKAILKGLAVQPEDRFQSAAEFLEAIESQQVVEVPDSQPASAPGAKQKKQKLALVAGVAAAVVIGVVGIGMALGGGSGGADGGGGVMEALAPKITIAGQQVSTADKVLELENTVLTEADLSAIGQMSNLRKIYFTDVELDQVGLTWMADISGLEEVSIEGYLNEIDLTPFANQTSLTRLSFYSNSNDQSSVVTDLTPLSGLTNLQQLDLYGTIPTLEPLSGLTNLTQLRLWGSVQTEDFTALSNLTKLQSLRISVSGTSSTAGLEHLTELRELEVNDSSNTGRSFYISDLSFLSGLTKLQTLRFDASGITSLKGVENLTDLREASFYGSDATYTDVDPLAGLTKLQRLRLPMHGNNTAAFDASALAGLTELTELDMECSVQSLEPLRNLTKLRVLSVRNGMVPEEGEVFSSLEPLSGLTELTDLSIRSAHSITDLSPLSGLTNLRTLYLDIYGEYRDPPLTDISPLGNLTQLQSLTLQERGLQDISPLRGCTNLKSLVIYEGGEERITDLSPVDHVPQVEIS